MACSHLEIAQALRLNPAITLALFAVGAWLVLSGLDWWSGRDWASRSVARISRRPWPAILVTLALLNWVYLIVALPR